MVVGFREDDEDAPAREIELKEQGRTAVLRSVGLSRLYVHDDRLGPYARAKWDLGDGAELRLSFEPRSPGFDAFEVPTRIYGALAPLYPKLRMSGLDLVQLGSQLLPLCWMLVEADQRESLMVELRFELSGQYLRATHPMDLGFERLKTLLTEVQLPRYLGLIRFSVEGHRFMDVLCDPTDIPRQVPAYSPILALIPHAPEVVQKLQELPQMTKIKVI